MLRRLVSCSVVGVLAAACAAREHAPNDSTEVIIPPAASSASSQQATDGSRAAPPSASASATTSPVAPPGGSAAAPAPRCPPTFAQAYDARCSIGDAPCTYPEGSCECGGLPHCGGAPVRTEPPGGPGHRHCTASDPGWRRADGCTDGAPKDGARCSKPGQVCKYGPCAWSAITATCRGGAWHLTQYRGPPPP